MENSLQQDISNVQLKRATEIDISTIIQKHIPIGTTKENAFKSLEAAGFKIYKQDEKAWRFRNPLPNPADELFIAGWKYKKMSFSHFEARALLYFKQGIVSNVFGEILYRSL